MEIAGYMGMGQEAFWRCTPRFFHNFRNGHDRIVQDKWEQARLIAYYSFAAYPKKNIPGMAKLIPFPWEEKKKKKRAKEMRFSEADLKAEFEKFLNL